ncbi:MAG: hypothetical protein FJX74_14285 [Armatimonadetes bacterium]|nr:hypothetical protein [Armatimonadota bacterium]
MLNAARVLLGVLLMSGSAFGARYHVSNAGSDANDGLSPEAAWASLERVNLGPYQPGDAVLFRRGDSWRGQLRPRSGSEAGYVTYGAYGEGPKPLLLGSVARNSPEDWTDEGNGIWSSGGALRVLGEALPQGADDTLEWRLHREEPAEATTSWDEADFDSAPASCRVECAASGESGNRIQLYIGPFAIERGKLYRLSVRAKCTAPFRMAMPHMMMMGAPWSSYSGGTGVSEVREDWTTCTQLYLANTTADDTRLTWYLGAALPTGAVLHLDSLSLEACDGSGWLAADVGNIILNEGERCGVKVWNAEDLQEPGQYWYDEAQHLVKLVCPQNPATLYESIELAIREHMIDQGGCSYVVYENLRLLYGGAHGIGGGSTHHIIVRDCDFGFIGGGDQMGGDRTVRFGNGVEFWGAAHDNLVERCRFWEIYDAALTNQSGGPETPEYNLIYRNNLIWNSEYSFEYWNRPEASETYNVQFVNNTCLNAGHGWGHTQRPDPSGRHLCFYNSPARAWDIVVSNNIFFEAKSHAFYAPGWTDEQIDALVMDHNCWYQAEGVMIDFKDSPYTMAEFARYQAERNKEPRSICADPLFVGAAGLDFRLRPESPCLNAGADLGVPDDFTGAARPADRPPSIGAY